jgi:hypothetical protein
VAVSGAKLIVSERSGLADLVALAGGIPECQFIARGARLGNSRLTEVCDSGCGMGHNVIFDENGKGNAELMRQACVTAIKNRTLLVDALRGFQAALAQSKSSAAVTSCPPK